jgi:hypothetical protein
LFDRSVHRSVLLRQFFFRNQFLFTQPVFFPYPVDTAPYYQTAEQSAPTVVGREDDLGREVGRLTNEVELLREEQVLRWEQAQQTALQAQPSREEKAPTTILVFRDGRRSEVQNYAVVGQTLWVFTEQRSRKIPVSDLDVETTKKLNSERGVELRIP